MTTNEMHEDLGQFQCTCDSDSSWDHSPTCNLWDSTEFENGRAIWHVVKKELYSIYEDFPEGDAHITPIDLESLHTATEDDIGGPIGDTVPPADDDEDPEDDEDEDESLGIVSNNEIVYSSRLVGDEGMQAYIEDAIDGWIGDDQEGAPANFSYRGVTWVWDDKKAQWEAKELGCYCGQSFLRDSTKVAEGSKNAPQVEECENCGVKRYPPNKRWRQTIFLEGEVTCDCKPSKGWTCGQCGVRRKSESHPWEKGDIVSTTGTQKSFKSYASGSGGWQDYTGGSYSYVPKCRHYGQTVTMPNGKTFWASSHHRRKEGEALPDFGFYLDGIWKPECIAFYIPWTDHGTPQLAWDKTMEAFKIIDKLADSGQIVELGCIGGHGRTGTALGVLAMMNGFEGDGTGVIKWVHDNYCTEAIEGSKQEWWLTWAYAYINGLPLPEMPVFTTTTVYGQKKETRSKNKGKKVSINKDGSGQFYCGSCMTDTKESPDDIKKLDPEKWPTVCWWCEGEFQYKGANPAPKAPAQSSSGTTAKASKAGGKGSSKAGSSTDPKESLARGDELPTAEALGLSGAEYGKRLFDLVLQRLWPKDRVKVWQAPNVMRCSKCGDKVSWRYVSGVGQVGNDWVHRTNPTLPLKSCNRAEGSYRR